MSQIFLQRGHVKVLSASATMYSSRQAGQNETTRPRTSSPHEGQVARFESTLRSHPGHGFVAGAGAAAFGLSGQPHSGQKASDSGTFAWHS